MSTKNICNVCGENCLYDTGEEIFGNSVYVAQKASINGLWKNENADYREDHSCTLCKACYNLVKNYIEKELGGKIDIKKYTIIDSVTEEWMTGETPKNRVPRSDNG